MKEEKWWHIIIKLIYAYMVTIPAMSSMWIVYPLWDKTVGERYHSGKFIAAIIAGWAFWYLLMYLIWDTVYANG